MRGSVHTHGYAGYANGCRCEVCRRAKAQYMRDKRHRAAIKRQSADPRTYVAEGITHGTYAGYADAQCRCRACAAAKAKADRTRKAAA